MAEDKWALLEGMALNRGYAVHVNDDAFELALQEKRNGVRRSWELTERGIEAASAWLLGKPVRPNTWSGSQATC